MKLYSEILGLLIILEVMEIFSQIVTIDPASETRIKEYEELTFTCSYTGPGTVLSVTWGKNGVDTGPLAVQGDGSCVVGVGTIDSAYSFSCINDVYRWKILNVTVAQDEDEWLCRINTGTIYDSSPAVISVQVCVLVSNGIANTTDRSPGTVVMIRCGNGESTVATCQADGSWLPSLDLNCEPVPEPCEIILCYILLILSCVLITPVFIGIHVYFIHKQHRRAVKKLTIKDFGKKACLPGCCICLLKIVIQLITYFLPFEECSVVTCLVVPIIAMPIVSGTGVAVVGRIVHRKRGKARPGNEKVEMTNDEPKPMERV